MSAKERPILFSTPMVRAILDGRKTQTRRIVKLDASGRVRLAGKSWHIDDPNSVIACPYGQVGDRLWVRETFSFIGLDHVFDLHEAQTIGVEKWLYKADGVQSEDGWWPSIHMPRAASRITLEITVVRCERLHAITEADAIAEGITKEYIKSDPFDGFHPPGSYGYVPGNISFPGGRIYQTAKEAYKALWESINGQGSWEQNPIVWVIEFKRVEQ